MKKSLVVMAGAAGLFLCSCGDSRFPGYDKTEEGIYYQVHKEGDKAKTISEGEVVFLTQVMYTDKDSLLFDSRKDLEPGQPYMVKIGKPMYPGDFFTALGMMHLGDSTSFYFSAKDIWDKIKKQPLPPFLDSTSYLKFSMRIDSIYSKEKVAELEKKRDEYMKQQQQMQAEMMKFYESKEDSLLNDGVKKFKFTGKPLKSGLYYAELKKGTGPKVKSGDVVSVNYTGKLITGDVFDSSEGRPEPFTFTVGTDPVIYAWEEAILNMSVGTKAKILCPSKLGYGPQGSGPIPPYAPLYFDIEIVGIDSATK